MAVAMVMAVVVAMLLVGAVGMGLLSASLRTSGAQRTAARALACAEAGLAAGRVFFLDQVGTWNSFLACNTGAPCPAGYPLRGAAGSDGQASYEVRLRDNRDEPPPAQDNPLTDLDLTVIIESRCTDPDLPPRVLLQHVSFDTTQLPDYRAQAGHGRARTGNQN
jgi:hypothetical protein